VERKLATVVFVDLVDSTGYVSTTDPEIVRRRVNRFFARFRNPDGSSRGASRATPR